MTLNRFIIFCAFAGRVKYIYDLLSISIILFIYDMSRTSTPRIGPCSQALSGKPLPFDSESLQQAVGLAVEVSINDIDILGKEKFIFIRGGDVNFKRGNKPLSFFIYGD